MGQSWAPLLLVALLSALPWRSEGQGVITMVATSYVVKEGQMFAVRVRKAGTASSEVNVVVEITNPDEFGGHDFHGTSQPKVIPAGLSEVERSVLFTVRDDDLPEPDETFNLRLKVTNGDGVVGTPSTATVTIAANDDAFGVFSFVEVLPKVVNEPSSPMFNIRRVGGIFGDVTLTYQVVGNEDEAVAGLDVQPATGTIQFVNEQTTAVLRLEVMNDDIPENDESFQIKLLQATGGQSIDATAGGPRIDDREAMLIISRNDAPLRFSQGEYRTDERAEAYRLTLTIYRGLNAESTSIVGPIVGPATVNLYFVSRSADAGTDYFGANTSVAFSSGVTQATITVQILPDDLPEEAEQFDVYLTDPSGDAVVIEPSVATVVIEANDEPHGVVRIKTEPGLPPVYHIDEDETSQYSDIVVTRGLGRFGEVSINWIITRLDSDEDVLTDLNPKSGTLVFQDGQEDVAVVLNIALERNAEPAERFRFELEPASVTGGARVEGIVNADIIMEDSDDIYGVIDLAGDNLQMFESMALPRALEIIVLRTGGGLGAIRINYTADYMVDDTVYTDLFSQPLPSSVLLDDGQLSATFSINIKDEAFLHYGAVFRVELLGTELLQVPAEGAYNSPRLGRRRTLSIGISPEAANGMIGFEDVTTRKVVEPDGAVLPVQQVVLVVNRNGTNGLARVEWMLEGVGSNALQVTPEDTGPTSGSITMESGQGRANIIVEILPDDQPETDEMVRVRLVAASPPGSQRIKDGADMVEILIQENDMPGGIFEFSPAMPSSFRVEEDGAAIEVTVLRYGGSLTTRYVQHVIEPNGVVEFYGATYVMKFEPGETSKNSTIIARSDGIAEVTEHFQLKLVTFGDNIASIGKKNTINITVLENDNPYGVFHFKDSSLSVSIDESKGGVNQSAFLTVVRSQGLYNTVSVRWVLLDGDTNEDVGPASGMLTFLPGQAEAVFRLQSTADEKPEGPETFVVNLTDPTGGSIIGSPQYAEITVNANDNPIFFKDPTTIRVLEPGRGTVTVARNGSLAVEVRVKFQTVDGTASAGDHDYVPVGETVITFAPGQDEYDIDVSVLDDSLPETDETFHLVLYDPEGDVSVFGGDRATITIMANDRANGIFHFIEPFTKSTMEGVPVEFDIKRDGGIYSEVQVHWEVLAVDTRQPLPDGGDFVLATGNVSFSDQQQVAPLVIAPATDNIPEYSEFFIIRLTHVSGGGPSGQEAELAATNLEVRLEVVQNDDPSGVFTFAATSREVSLPEDVPPGQLQIERTRALLTVTRRQGAVGTVMVAWEIFSNQISTAGKLPSLRELLFLGDYPINVTEVSEPRRLGTGSMVLWFSGCDVCFVRVPAESQMPFDTIEDGFSLSAWVLPDPGTDGYVLAKTTPDGLRHYFALRLATSATSTRIEFRYSVKENQNNHVAARTEPIGIEDGAWHHLLVTVDSGLVEFFLDGQSLSASRLVEESTLDGPGDLTVGAITPGAERFTGYMQDVRIFSRKLDLGEVGELFVTPAREDVRPTSGYLRYQEGERDHTVTIFSVDDNEEEANELFAVRLISARGGARVSDTDGTAVLTVLKSDNANGLFGIYGPCTMESPNVESSLWSCPVLRQRGDADEVTLTWEVRGPLTSTSGLATSDFVNATGELVFQSGQRESTLILEGLDDDVPELPQQFDVVLTAAASSDGLVGSTATSGASIDPAAERAQITAPENDYPYGLFEFSTDPPPSDDDPRTPPTSDAPSVDVTEESGIVRLLVVRAQGLVGQVSVEWRTVDGTAVSSGKTPPDYVRRVGRLVFQPGQRFAYVEVQLIDNSVPENLKTFSVQLVNPDGGAAVGLGATITVHVQPSDQAFGVFQFEDGSLDVTTDEQADQGLAYKEVALRVMRAGGSIGEVNVTWAVLADASNDLHETAGVLTFDPGQTEALLVLRVRDDSRPELDEKFTVQLMTATEGSIGSQSVSYVTVEANDDPYGVFIISQADRPKRTQEENTVVTLTVQRTELSGRFGAVNVTWRTLVPGEVYPYLPGGTLRAQEEDFSLTSGWVLLTSQDLEATFNVTINDDLEPEIAESVFVLLSGVELVEAAQTRPVASSPRLGDPPETYGQIIIDENDNPAGVLQLSTDRVAVTEDFVGTVLSVNRSAGTFGQVTVKFEVVQGGATYGLDYSMTSTDVVLNSGEQSKRVPVEIINDQIPELEETFTVRLLDQITGGATLGTVREASIVILPSDDPYGAFAFEEAARSVEEPPEGTNLVVSLPVTRKGGSVGVVTVTWEASLAGEEPTEDISPSSGDIFFVSNEARQSITLEVLPDNVPEGVESIVLTLVEATNGGRIDTTRHQLILSIAANDNPHGLVGFGDGPIIVEESDVDAPQYVRVSRIGGNYGDVRVFYETLEVDLMELALEEEQSVLAYYLAPVPGKIILPNAGTPYPVQGLPDPLIACARFCLMSEACLSFEYNASRPDCNWFTLADMTFIGERPGYMYYMTNQDKKSALFRRRARPGLDYEPVTAADVILNDGATFGLLPVTVMADDIPELPELFNIRLLRVELVGGPPNNPNNLPQLSDRPEATVTIDKNDNANGVFRLTTADPRAMAGQQTLMVEERDKFSVELIVERQGGAIGEAMVTWSINPDLTTATRGLDFIADGATFKFDPGVTRRTLTIGIEDDSMPENDETLVVEIHDPQGGATISANNAVTVIIQANDNVAGRLYFTETAYLVKEGDLLVVTAERSEPALGEVTVDWHLTTVNSQRPELRFNLINGTLTFLPDEHKKEIEIEVLVDNQPKINQEYELQLTNARTSGVRDTGAAGVDPQRGVAVVTIEGGNEPHGVFSFASGSQNLRVAESVGRAQLTIDRKFGAIGDVRVNYEVKVGSLSPLTADLQVALANDFAPVTADYVTVADGLSSGVVPVVIFEDDQPEVDEVLLVTITSVELLGQTAGNFLPKLATAGTVAEVTIEANDGTFGEVVFSEQSVRMHLVEETTNVTLVVLRSRGTFGDVSVFCFAQSLADGAIRGQDFNFEPREITFLAGEDIKYVVVALYDDEDPEPNEQLEIILASPKGGLTVGNSHKSVITILASDRASGVVSFESNDVITLNELTSGQSRAELRLTRAPGVFGVVNVPYEVRAEGGGDDPVTDLSPTSGYVTFRDREGVVTLELKVEDDDIPEEAETFVVTLLPPDKASLGLITQRTIVIERNDAPYGLLQVFPAGTRNRTVTLEEGNRVVYVDVQRSQGSLDEVSVDLVTRSITAHSQMGPDLYSSTLQQLNVRDMTRWASYEHGGETYLVLLYAHQVGPLTTPLGSSGAGRPVALGNITQTVLFRWQGAAVLVQSIETDGAQGATAFNIEGTTYLFIVNSGGRTRRETNSRLYMVKDDGTLEAVQNVRTQGATDAEFFTRGSDHFLVVTNAMDNTGRTNINSDVYQWDYFTNKFSPSPVQYLATRGAAAAKVTVVDDVVYLVIANKEDASAQTYEINSLVYRLDADNRFTIHQQLPTKGAADVTAFHIGSDSYIVVANSRDDSNRHNQMATIYVWNRVTQLFSPVQQVAQAYVGTVHSFVTPDGKVHLSIAMQRSPSAILTWDDDIGQFNQTWVGPPLKDLHPVTVNQRAGPLVLLPDARPVNESAGSLVSISQLSRLDLGDSDYVHRALTLTFKPDQTSLRTSAVLLEDDVPENTEAMVLELTNPRGGAELGANKEVVIDILSNDNGHGILEFAEDSLERWEEEISGRDNLVQLNVVRRQGTYGRVVVRWRAEGEHNGVFDFTPIQGQLEFADDQAVASITLTIKDDQVAELDEVTRVTLVEIIESGTPIPGRGARIGEKSSSRVTVMANDSPHGVVAWERSSYITTEPEGTDTTTMIHVVRTQGTRGTIRVGYITSRDVNLPDKQQAVSGQDYVAIQSSVDMQDGVSRVPVEITILSDLNPEVAETFLVNITAVQLVGGATILGAGASVRRPGNVASLTIAENDDARGIVQFNVARNAEGRVDTFEGVGTISLRLVRTVGFFGEVQVAWQASPRQATTDDFSPGSGTVTFSEGQNEAFLDISIIDEDVPEDLETFDIQLIRVTSGGATLGANNSVRVGIIRNDSPNGIFSFVQASISKTVRESKTSEDPDGAVKFDVQRAGTEGVVNVEWRLSPEAVDDFVPPLTGIITFGPGEAYKQIVLRTRVDNILEGEEEFTLSLVAADNNGDVSPTDGDATVVILADSGASGLISIAPESRSLLLGEPTVDYSGRAEVVLERRVGTFGEVRVTWQITRRDADAFVQQQDTVILADKQARTVFTVQTKDDNTPEMRHTYVLELTSATGGATIDPAARMANIMVVASDFPHGRFEFGTPQEITVSEDAIQVTIPVERHLGSAGLVRVEYTTTPGTAVSDETLTPDFRSSRGWLVFGNNQRRQTIAVDIVNDVRAEGPEYFYVNLTQVQLQQPSNNNYTLVGGLLLDMPPEVGELDYKMITIEKNDNAEGVVEFSQEAINFIVQEESGQARLPVVRGPGTFGDVRVRYTSRNLSATPGADYRLTDGELLIPSGAPSATLNVTIVDDALREFAERFEVRLSDASGGALLGARTTATVTIAKSDYPNGLFSFVGQTTVTIPNPDQTRSLALSIARTRGLIGRQTVYWRIMGPNDPNRVLVETNDLSSPGSSGRQVTSGILLWEANEDGQKSFVVTVKPHAGWEIAKTFSVVIYDIQGFPADSGSGEASLTANNFTLMVQKFGDPNGIVRFDGVAQQLRIFQEPAVGKRLVRFPIYRTEGTIGRVGVNWQVQGPAGNNVSADVDPASGTAYIDGDKRNGEVVLFIMADGRPELEEVFFMYLTAAEGGAEIDNKYNSSRFTIQYNGFPHGRFALDPAAQTVVISPGSLQRSVRLNISRQDGDVGVVRVTYTIVYDQAQSGISYVPSAGAVQFEDGSRFGVALIDIENTVSIKPGTSFTATLTDAVFIGIGVTMRPQLIAGRTTAKIYVTPEAANSEVGFKDTVISVDEETNLADVVVERRGTYGGVQVDWVTGYPDTQTPSGFSRGRLSDESGVVSMVNTANTTSFKVQLSPRPSVPELFALHLPRQPASQTVGGADLWPGRDLLRIEPYGVVRFDLGSLNVNVQEPEDREAEVTLDIERVYGSLEAIQIRYNTYSGTALGGVDYREIQNGAVNMDPRQTRSTIFVQIVPDTIPEQDEYFFVNFTSITRLPTGPEQGISPRLSSLHSSAKVTITRNNDPYGVVSIVVKSGESDGKVTEPGSVTFSVIRTGGTFGRISVQVRTIGGGETWDSHVGTSPGRTNETISEVLGNRDLRHRALANQDYQIVDRTLVFQESETEMEVVALVQDDPSAEDDEEFFVYLVPQTEGVRTARPALDNGRKGYASVTIRRNDFWNGWIGFARANSTRVEADEDSGQPARLTIERLNASLGAVRVSWKARVSQQVDSLTLGRMDLTRQLDRFSNEVDCPAGSRFCVFDVPLINDNEPENETSFVVELKSVGDGAQIDPARRFASVVLLPSDNPDGLVQFAESSRVVYVEKSSRTARLEIERTGYREKRVSVRVSTLQLPGSGPDVVAGVPVYHALDGSDFSSFQSQLVFEPGDRSKTISITMDLSRASDNPYPKIFRVALSDVTNGAVLGVDRANVTIVDQVDIPLWNVWRQAQQRDLTNNTIDGVMRDLERAVREPLNPMQLNLVEDNLDTIVSVAESRPLLQGSRISIMSVFCRLLDPARQDATQGRWQLHRLLERFAYTYLIDYPCDQCCTATSDLIYSPECQYVQFAVAKWYPENINGYRYQGLYQDNYIVPDNLLRVQDNGRNSPTPKCMAMSFVQYSSDQWFTRGSDVTLLNNRVISVGIRGQPSRELTTPATYRIYTKDRRIAPQRAKCAYFDEPTQQWTDRMCSVTNNLQLATDTFVDCSCKHMTSYTVISEVKNPDLIGYPVLFHISCVAAMIGLLIAIISHHTCVRGPMFSANLLMHFLFAILATELCYLIDAFIAPDHLLNIGPTDTNTRCIVMGVFVHYFFLAQFTWMMMQAVNFWKILVLNDEHTERKYVMYFLLGWGLPGLIVFLFCLVTYLVVRYGYDDLAAADRFYGDVNSNQDICFIVNQYAALGGVIVPAVICLMVVGIVFIQAFQITPQWQAYDDIYRSRYNLQEIRFLLFFWAIVFLTWLWGGLHMAYGQYWMLILFFLFNLAIGVYALVVYSLLRNRWCACLKPQKETYAVNYGASDAGEVIYPPPGALPSIVGSVKGSRASLINEAWERESLPTQNGLKVKRSPVTGGVYVVPAPPYDPVKPPSQRTADRDSQDFDELIFALKTGGGYTPSDSSHPPNPHEVPDPDSANYEMRRISIADTHL